MIYFIVTTSLYDNCITRQTQYVTAITKLKNMLEGNLNNYKIIIVENNGTRDTVLNNLGCDVLYTRNNFISAINKGIKELMDVFDCIDFFHIQDDDFIVKMTGRYVLEEDSEFIKAILNLHNTNYECVVRYGSCFEEASDKVKDCTSGLVGMLCRYMKQIKLPLEEECAEWKWGEATYLIEDTKVCSLKILGIQICPNSNTYFLV